MYHARPLLLDTIVTVPEYSAIPTYNVLLYDSYLPKTSIRHFKPA